MKVCHITTVHKVYDVRIFHKQCCSLKKRGFNVSLIAPNAQEKEKEGEKGDREGAESLGKENREGVQDVRLNRSRRAAGE